MFDIQQINLENTGHLLNVPDIEIDKRLNRVRAFLRSKGLTVLVIVNRCAEGYTAWLTGRPMPDIPFNRSGGFIVPADGTPVDVDSDTLVTEEYLRNYRKLDETVTVPAKNPLFRAAIGWYVPDIARCLTPGDKRVAVVHLNDMTASLYDFIRDGIEGLSLVDVSAEMALLRAERTTFEMEYSAYSARSADRVFSALPYLLRPGRLESEISADLRKRVYDLGAGGQDTGRMADVRLISAPQDQAAQAGPILYPGRRLALGDAVNVCLRAISVNDLYAALGRLYVLGEIEADTRTLWNHAVAAQDAAAGALCPGASLEDAAAALEAYCEKNSLILCPENPLYGIGYVIGEAPVLYTVSGRAPLKTGMILAVAPTVSFPGDTRRYCCMDTYRIDEGGATRLTRTSRELTRLE